MYRVLLAAGSLGGSVWVLPLIAAAGYLLGSFNTSIPVSKHFLHKDIRDYGSGNAGWTNAVRCMGVKYSSLVLAGDVLKCAIACILGQLLYCGGFSYYAGAPGRLIAGAFAFLGHIYPLYFGFRGGKGVVTLAITVAFFDWRIFLIGLALFVIIVAISKYISLGSIVIAVYFPIAVTVFAFVDGMGTYGWITDLTVSLGMSVILILKHRSNIKRLVKGTESRFSFKSKPIMQEDEKNK